jgi:hypothetical protein
MISIFYFFINLIFFYLRKNLTNAKLTLKRVIEELGQNE